MTRASRSRPGLRLTLVDGTYTPTNRPIQDLVTFHEVGRMALGLDWERTLGTLAGGLTYRQMVAAAEQAHFRDALDFIARETVDLFEQVLDREPRLEHVLRSCSDDGANQGG